MLQLLVDRLADIFHANPDDSARAAALLLALYVGTAIPLLSWLFLGVFKRPASKPQVPRLLRSCLQTAIVRLWATLHQPQAALAKDQQPCPQL